MILFVHRSIEFFLMEVRSEGKREKINNLIFQRIKMIQFIAFESHNRQPLSEILACINILYALCMAQKNRRIYGGN